ncbi:hypothetical protein ACFYN3_28330 [Streptomyces lavendulae]|uniref:hypothetical protein n=1 Tax=Streptomyces lavendulae TaxID=1914 RepID=UPI0036740F84
MIHDTPTPGDIGLVRTDSPTGTLIRIGQWLNGDGFGNYQHAFLVLPDGQLIEAAPKGTRLSPSSDYTGKRVLYVCPEGLTQQQRQDICAAARQYIGVPYSFLDYAAIAAHRFHLPVPGLRRYVASTRHQICSQLVDQCYEDAGVRLFTDGRWPGYVTPMALYDLLAKGPEPAGR